MAGFLKQVSLVHHKTIYVEDWNIFRAEGPNKINCSLFPSQKVNAQYLRDF